MKTRSETLKDILNRADYSAKTRKNATYSNRLTDYNRFKREISAIGLDHKEYEHLIKTLANIFKV